jgi:hypothetical protein
MVEIEQYQFSWHTKDGRVFRIRAKSSAEWSEWIKVPSAAIAAILHEKPVFFNPENRLFYRRRGNQLVKRALKK